WSDQATAFAGRALARGGAAGGNGGLVETSSQGVLGVTGSVDASAPHGLGGQWLLDPSDIDIVDTGSLPSNPFTASAASATVGMDSIIAVLTTGTDVTIDTTSAFGSNGDITYTATPGAFAIGGDGSATLTLNATRLVDWTGDLVVSGGTLNLDVNAGGQINVQSSTIVADKVDLTGCLTFGADCGLPSSGPVVPIGIVLGTSRGVTTTVSITAREVDLLGGQGGVFAGTTSAVNASQLLHLQGFGDETLSLLGTINPGAGATALITPAFSNSSLGIAVRDVADTSNLGIDNNDIAALGGFQSITLRSGAASSTLAATDPSAPGDVPDVVLFGTFSGATIDLPTDLILEAHDGGESRVNFNVQVTGGSNLTLSSETSAGLFADVTVAGDITVTAPAILLDGSFTSTGGRFDATGTVSARQPTAITAADGILIDGTLSGNSSDAIITEPDIALTVTGATGSVTVTGAAGIGVSLGSLTVSAPDISLASVTALGAIDLTGDTMELAGTYLAGSFQTHSASATPHSLTLTGDVTVQTTGAIGIDGTVDADGGLEALSLTSTDSSILLAQGIGQGVRPGSVMMSAVNGDVSTGSVAAASLISLTGSTVTLTGATYAVSAGDISITGPGGVSLFQDTLLDASGAGSIDVTGPVGPGGSVTAGLTALAGPSGHVTFNDALGNISTPLSFVVASAGGDVTLNGVETTGDQTYSAANLLFNAGSYHSTGGAIDAGAAVTSLISGDVSVIADTGAVTFGAVEPNGAGVNRLTATAGTTLAFNGAVGGLKALDSLTASAGTSITANGVATVGDQIYTAPLATFNAGTYSSAAGFFDASAAVQSLIAGAVTVDAGVNVDFAAVDAASASGNSLTIRATNEAVLGGSIGAATPLDSITVTGLNALDAHGLIATGAVSLTSASVNLVGGTLSAGTDFLIDGPVFLFTDKTITAGRQLTITGTVDLDSSAAPTDGLTLTSTGGDVTVTGAVGGTLAPDHLIATASGSLGLADVTTTGDQTLAGATIALNGTAYQAGGSFQATGATTLAGDTMIDSAGDVDFAGTIRRAGANPAGLTVTAGTGRTITLGGAAGTQAAPLAFVDLGFTAADGANTLFLAGIETTGGQTFSAATATFGTGIYRSTAGDFDATGVGTSVIGGAVQVLAGNASFGSVEGDGSGSATLDVTATGDIALGAVGATTPIDRLVASATGRIDAAALRATGDILLTGSPVAFTAGSYQAGGQFRVSGPLLLATETTVAATGALTVDGSIDLDSIADPVDGVTLVSTTGDVTVSGVVGLIGTPDHFSATASAGTVTVDGIRTAGDTTLSGTTVALTGGFYGIGGSFQATGATTLAVDTTLLAGADITFTGTIDRAAGAAAAGLRATAGMGDSLTVTGAIGQTRSLAFLELTAGNRISLAGATTTSDQDLTAPNGITLAGTYIAGGGFTATGPTMVSGAVSLTAATGPVLFDGTIDGQDSPGDTITATATLGDLTVTGAVGANQPLGAVSLAAGGTLSAGNIDTLGALSLRGDLVRLAGGTLTAGTALTLDGPVDLVATTVLQAGDDITVTGRIDTDAAASLAASLGAVSSGGGVDLQGAVGGLRHVENVLLSSATGSHLANVAADGFLLVAGTFALTGSTYVIGGLTAFLGAGTLAQDTTLTAGYTVVFSDTVDAAAGPASPVGLTIDAGSNEVLLGGRFGGAGGLASLAVTGGQIDVGSDITTIGDQTYTASLVTVGDPVGGTLALRSTTGDIHVAGPLIIDGAVTMVAGRDVRLDGTTDGASVGSVAALTGGLTIDAGRNALVLGPVGSISPLSGFSVTAGALIDPPSVFTVGPQFYSAPVIVLSGDTYSTGGGAFTTMGELRLTSSSVLIDTTPLTSGSSGDITLEGPSYGRSVSLNAGEGAISAADVAFDALTVYGVEGSADMGGTIGGHRGLAAARFVERPDGISKSYEINGCIMGTMCGAESVGVSVVDFQLPNLLPQLIMMPPP
ncbi:beta strand repeat-containing protein, partial [Zavarzinia sp.]|uniref:beta strand repeat-containing protein n=1 Tax=Zavarzinia sp. TaxID=2027920 RepID=UPI00356A8B39